MCIDLLIIGVKCDWKVLISVNFEMLWMDMTDSSRKNDERWKKMIDKIDGMWENKDRKREKPS